MQASFLASIGRILWRLAEAHSIDAQALFSRNGLDFTTIHESRARYPVNLVAHAWLEVAAVTSNPHLGLEAAKHYSPLDFNALGVTFLSSFTLIDALQRLDRYESVLNSSMDFTIVEKDGRIDLTCTVPVVNPAAVRIMEDARTSVLLDLCRTGLNHSLDPIEVAFTYPEPPNTGDHFGVCRCPLVFSAEISRISFQLSDTLRPFTEACRELAIVNDQILDGMVRDLRSSDVVSRVKRAIIDALPSGAPDQSDIAKRILLSNRTLQRKLADEGTSFRSLLVEVRRELAKKYIADNAMPLSEISYMLGFADTSSFSRAFKRWTGGPPNECRASAPP